MNRKQHMEWVPEIDYRGYSLTLLALEIKEAEEKTGKTRTLTFQWLTDLTVKASSMWTAWTIMR